MANQFSITKKDEYSQDSARKCERYSQMVGLKGLTVHFDHESSLFRVRHRGSEDWFGNVNEVMKEIISIAQVWRK